MKIMKTVELIEMPQRVGTPFYVYKSKNDISWVKKEKGKKNTWVLLYGYSYCRTRLNDYWYTVMKSKKYNFPNIPNPTRRTIDKKHTCLWIRNTNNVNLAPLHKKEKAARVALTRVYQAGGGYIFIGDKAWQSCLWKLTLYSYFVKQSVNPMYDEFTHYLKGGNEKVLLSKVKDFNDEVLFTNNNIYELSSSVHVLSGFVSICQGYNKEMYKKIFDKEYGK